VTLTNRPGRYAGKARIDEEMAMVDVPSAGCRVTRGSTPSHAAAGHEFAGDVRIGNL